MSTDGKLTNGNGQAVIEDRLKTLEALDLQVRACVETSKRLAEARHEYLDQVTTLRLQALHRAAIMAQSQLLRERYTHWEPPK